MLATILIVVLVLALLGALPRLGLRRDCDYDRDCDCRPRGSYRRNWNGWGGWDDDGRRVEPTNILALILVVAVVLVVLGQF